MGSVDTSALEALENPRSQDRVSEREKGVIEKCSDAVSGGTVVSDAEAICTASFVRFEDEWDGLLVGGLREAVAGRSGADPSAGRGVRGPSRENSWWTTRWW